MPVLVGFKLLGILSRKQAKSSFLRYYFKSIPLAGLQSSPGAFARQRIEKRLRPSLAARLRWHRQQGHRCIIISASLDLWVEPIAEALGVESISSKGLYEGDRLVGLDGENCHGPEKVRRLLEYLNGEEYGMRYAYGDSSGDRELIQWADQGYWANKPLPPLE
ncbi:MAG: HAD-IB family phosphatase [Bacteroidia bacterium]